MADTLSQVIVPELFNPYVINRTKEKSAFFQSGIVASNAKYDALASQTAPTVNMPFFEDLNGDSEAVVEGQDLTPAKLGSQNDVAAIFRRAKMWYASDLDAALSGLDPMKAVGERVASFWARDMQHELIQILAGVFGAATMKDNILDISTLEGAAANWTANAFIDAEEKLGDAKTDLTAVVMHSATEAYLKKQNLIQTVQPSSDVAFGLYQGKRVIVDDGCPASAGVYTTYLFGDGAVAYGNGSPVGFVPTEIDRDKKKGSGVDYLINRRTSILHPIGVAWTGSSVANAAFGPTRAEFAKAANWKRVYETKQIRIVAFKHKLG